MSVLIVDLKVYDYVRQGIIKVAYLSEHTEFYSDRIRQHFSTKEVHEEAERLVKSWLSLNERSYNMRYKETTSVVMHHFFESKGGHEITFLQFLKYLIAIYYNISKGACISDADKADYELLRFTIEDLKDSFIGNLPEYQSAKWSNYE